MNSSASDRKQSCSCDWIYFTYGEEYQPHLENGPPPQGCRMASLHIERCHLGCTPKTITNTDLLDGFHKNCHKLTTSPDKPDKKQPQRYRTQNKSIGKPNNIPAQFDEPTVPSCYSNFLHINSAYFISDAVTVYGLHHCMHPTQKYRW